VSRSGLRLRVACLWVDRLGSSSLRPIHFESYHSCHSGDRPYACGELSSRPDGSLTLSSGQSSSSTVIAAPVWNFKASEQRCGQRRRPALGSSDSVCSSLSSPQLSLIDMGVRQRTAPSATTGGMWLASTWSRAAQAEAMQTIRSTAARLELVCGTPGWDRRADSVSDRSMRR